jgi:hypothetical protein
MEKMGANVIKCMILGHTAVASAPRNLLEVLILEPTLDLLNINSKDGHPGSHEVHDFPAVFTVFE